jgi:plastocyanin
LNKTYLSITISATLIATIGLFFTFTITLSSPYHQTFAQGPIEIFIAPGASDPNNNEGAYVPSEIHVPQRTIVTWLNDDFTDHTVTTNDYRLFDSGPISPGSTFENAFVSTGEYGYHCTIHPFMRGIVIVE